MRNAMKTLSLFVGFSAVLFGAYVAEAVTRSVTNELACTTTETSVLTAEATLPVTESQFLAKLGTPSFWADASDRTLWKIANDGKVTNILDKAGSGRWVQTAKYVGTDYKTAKTAPTLVFDDKLGGGAYLDFGAKGATSGLVFSPEPGTESETCPAGSNDLQRIGTVLMVMNSSKGGGSLLGDGAGVMTTMKGALKFFDHGGQYGRGIDDTLTAAFGFTAPLYYQESNANYAQATHSGTYFREWGRAAKVGNEGAGFRGGWDVLSFRFNASLEARATFFGMGGQDIAEIVFFDRVLSREECAFAEAYLANKWLAVPTPGYGGEHRLGRLTAQDATAGADSDLGHEVEVNVSAGETLSIAEVRGGRGDKAVLVKTGEGTLEIDDAGAYGGKLRLEAGTLAFSGRAVPTALPSNFYFHVDASAPNALETDGDYVNFIRNDSGVTWKYATNKKAEISGLIPDNEARRPTLIRDALGSGLHAVDLGAWKSVASGGVFLKAVTNYTGGVASAYGTATATGVGTIVAVLGAQQGGGILSSGTAKSTAVFNRLKRNTASFDNSLMTDGTYPAEVPSAVWVNGVRQADSSGYASPDYQVLAVQTDGGPFGRVGWLDDSAGGMRICEMAFYRGHLSDTEIRDAQAYLLKKWFGRTAPGYRHEATSRAAVVPCVEVTGDAAVEVADGATLRVGSLTVASGAKLEKRGTGVFRAQGSDVKAGGEVDVSGGLVLMGDASDVSAKCEVASGSSLHLDADEASMVLTESDGLNLVKYWNDRNHQMFLKATAEGALPYLDGETTLAGRPTVNFGVRNISGQTPRSLEFSRTLGAIRSVYAVVRHKSESAQLFGAKTNYQFNRGVSGALFSNNANCKTAYNAEVHIDGGEATDGTAVIDADFHLVEFHTATPAEAENLTLDRGSYSARSGGIQLAELIVYERPLSAREKVATRNALLKKWFGKTDAELEDLPPSPASVEYVPLSGTTTRVDGNTATNSVPEGVSVAGDVAGVGTVVKDGEGTLVVRDLSQLAGTVAVAAGTLKLTGRIPYAEPALPKDGLLVHLDANVGVTTAANGNLDTWEDADGGSYKAVGFRTDRANPYPQTYETDSRLTYMDVGNRGYYGASLRFKDADGNWACVSNVCSAFWVLGSQQGGGYLLTGEAGTMTYARTVTDWSKPLFSTTYATQNIYDPARARFFCNGQLVDQRADNVLSGGWDVLSMSQTDAATASLVVSGYAVSGRNLSGSQDETKSGFMNLGETLLYDRQLSDEEQLQVQTYLSYKWSIGNLARGAADEAAIDLAADATLDCGGVTQRVAQISGSGSIVNGTAQVKKIVVDLANPATLTAEDFVFAEGFSVEVLNPVSLDEPIVLVEAENFGGLENLSRTAVTPADRYCLKCRNGRLLLAPIKGLMLIVR